METAIEALRADKQATRAKITQILAEFEDRWGQHIVSDGIKVERFNGSTRFSSSGKIVAVHFGVEI